MLLLRVRACVCDGVISEALVGSIHYAFTLLLEGWSSLFDTSLLGIARRYEQTCVYNSVWLDGAGEGVRVMICVS